MNSSASRGFTLIELMIALAVIGILVAVAYPSYQNYVVRASREAAKTELLELANLQERIYLNANAYSPNVAAAYNGQATGGLGKTTGRTNDGRYNITIDINAPSQAYVLTATPVAGGPQDGDGVLSISSEGRRLWNGQPW